MTFITVIRTATFPVGSVEVELTGKFTGNLTGNVLNATIVQSEQGQFDTISAATVNGTIVVSDNLCISAANILQVDTINDKSGSGVNVEGVVLLNGVFTSNVCIDASKYLQTDHIKAKGTTITIHDPVIMSSSADQIRFTSGIEIGDSNTNTTSTNAVAIGKSAKALGTNSTALGVQGNASANYSIAIGSGAIATTQDEIVFGRTVGASASAVATAWGQTFQDRAWVDSFANIAAIDGSGSIYKTAVLTSELATLGNITNWCVTGTRTGAGTVLLTPKPTIPLDEVWGFTIDVVGRETGSGNIFYEQQSILAHNNGGNVSVTNISTISSYGSGSLSADTYSIVGNLNAMDITVSTASTGTTNWTGKLHITTVI